MTYNYSDQLFYVLYFFSHSSYFQFNEGGCWFSLILNLYIITRPFYLNSLKQSQYLNSLNDTRKYIYVTSSVAEESYGA